MYRSTPCSVNQSRTHDGKNEFVTYPHIANHLLPVLDTILRKFREKNWQKWFIPISYSLAAFQESARHDHCDKVLCRIEPHGFVSPHQSTQAVTLKPNWNAAKINGVAPAITEHDRTFRYRGNTARFAVLHPMPN